MKAKKIMALALSVVMTLGLAACGGSSTTTTQTTASTENIASSKETTTESSMTETTKMSIILRGGSYADVIKAALPEFEEANNVQVEVLEMSFDDLHTGIVLDAVNSVGSYDLCMVDGSWMAEFTENNVLKNLSEMGYSFDEDIIPNTTAICMVGEDIYLAPYFGNVTVTLYNKTLVEDAGYKPEEITTLVDMLEVAKSAKANGANGFVFRGDTGDNILSDFLPILLAHGGWVIDENNQPTVNTKEFISAMEYYLELVGTGSAMSKDDVVASIDNQSAAIGIGWPGWYVPTEDSAADYMVSPSSADGVENYNTSVYGTWTIGIPENSPNPDLALKLLEFIMDPEVQLESVANGGVPCRYSSLKNEEILAVYPHLSTVCDALENGVYRPVIAEWTEFTNILGTEMGNVIAGTKTVDDALSFAQTQLENLMR